MEESIFQPDYMKILKALRSIGHLPHDAIRDIVDNGFDANATEVSVYFNEKAQSAKAKERKELSSVYIVDNGDGMSTYELTKALVPADTGRDRDIQNDLGKFGIGLLASGLSFANKIEVITKGIKGYLYTYISYSEKLQTRTPVNEVRKCTPEEIALIEPYLKGSPSGTMVIISEIDRLPATSKTVFDLRLNTTFAISRGYFHLAGKAVAKIDGKPVRYYDPLERNQAINVSREYKIPIHKDAYGNTLTNEFVTVVLSMIRPRRSDLVNREFPKLQNPSQKSQGFSIVRNGRELCWGQTFDMYEPSQPSNQFRGEIRYSGKYLDEYMFDVSVTKDRVQILDKPVRDKIDQLRADFFRDVVLPVYTDQRLYNKSVRAVNATTVTSTKTSAKPKPKPVVNLNPIVSRILAINTSDTTPNQALQILMELKDEAKKFESKTGQTATI